ARDRRAEHSQCAAVPCDGRCEEYTAPGTRAAGSAGETGLARAARLACFEFACRRAGSPCGAYSAGPAQGRVGTDGAVHDRHGAGFGIESTAFRVETVVPLRAIAALGCVSFQRHVIELDGARVNIGSATLSDVCWVDGLVVGDGGARDGQRA